MQTWRQRWRFWRHRLPDVVVSLLAVLVMTRYAATKPTNQLQNSGIVLLRSGGGSGAVVTAEDIARGYRLASVSTNVAVSYSCPTNGAAWASWTRRGAFRDWFTLAFPADWTFPLGSNELDRVTVFADARIRPSLREAAHEIAALGSPASAVPGVSEFWSATGSGGSQLLTWRDFFFGRGEGEQVSAQIELSPSGDFAVRSNSVERAYARIVPFDLDGDGLANDIDPEPCVYNGDYHGQTAAARESVLGQVGVGLENGWYFLSATFPEKPVRPTLVSVGTNRMVVVESGEYLFLLEKGIVHDIHVEPWRDDIVYDAYDDVLDAQNPAAPLLRSIEWWTPGPGGGQWHDDSSVWSLSPGYLDLCPSVYVAWWPGFKGSPDPVDLPSGENCVFTGVFTDCRVDVPAQYEWQCYFWPIPIVSPNAKTTELLAPPEALSNSVISVTATIGGLEFRSYVGGSDHLVSNGMVRSGYYVGAAPVVFRGGARRPLVAYSHTDDPDYAPLPTNGTLTLSFESGSDHVRLWSAEQGGTEVSLPRSWPVAEFNGFTCYIEGLSDSTNIEKTVFRLAYAGYAGSKEDSADTYVCNPPRIVAPNVVGVNDDDDNSNGTNDWEEVGSLAGDDDVVPVRVMAQMPPNVGGSVKLKEWLSTDATLWRDSSRSDSIVNVDLAIPGSGEVDETFYVESRCESFGYRTDKLEVISSCGGSVAAAEHLMTFVERIAQPITNERKDGVIVNPCGAVTNAVTRMKVEVYPTSFPNDMIVWNVVEGSASFVGGNTGREIAFMATGAVNSPIVLEVDFDGCPGRRPQFTLTTCEMRAIPVYPCTITDGKHPSPITESHLASMLDEVNVIFRQVGLSFYLGAPITNVVNRIWAKNGLMNKASKMNIRNIMPNTGGIEVYFIAGLGRNDALFGDQPRGLSNPDGIIVKGTISASTLAHEIGHLCNWKDIYAYGRNYTADELDAEVSEQWLPNDWNNGTGGRFYPVLFSQKNAIKQLLMHGGDNGIRADIPSGNVYGLMIDKVRDANGAIIREQYGINYIYVGGLPLFLPPTTRKNGE